MKGKKRRNVSTVVEAETKSVVAETVPVAGEPTPMVEKSGGFDRMWFGAAAFIVAVATFLRFYDLTLKVMHHDEGVNGFFLKNRKLRFLRETPW